MGFLESLATGQQPFEPLHDSLTPGIVEGAEAVKVFGQGAPIAQILQGCVAVSGPVNR